MAARSGKKKKKTVSKKKAPTPTGVNAFTRARALQNASRTPEQRRAIAKNANDSLQEAIKAADMKVNALLEKAHGSSLSGRTYPPEDKIKRMAVFLAAISRRPVLRFACAAAGIGRGAALSWKKKYPIFSELWDQAQNHGIDQLEEEAWRRGHDGYDKPVIYQGEITDTYKEYSDRCLEIMLRGCRPEKFKERSEISGPGGGPITLQALERRVIGADGQQKKLEDLYPESDE